MSPHRPALRVLLCDGCCCGTRRKHPDVDHAAQRARLGHSARQGGGVVRTTGCVDRCAWSNVVAVRHVGGDATWLGAVLDQVAERAVASWLAGGADPSAMTADVRRLVIPSDGATEPLVLRARPDAAPATERPATASAIAGPEDVARG